MNIYNDNGYLNFKKIRQIPVPFIFIIGGRGIGKTYGALEDLTEEHIQFLFMRRTQSQVEMIKKPEFSPYKTLNADKNWNIIPETISKYTSGFYEGVEADGKIKAAGAPIAYICALSTISNIRGFDGSDIKVMLYDEFIPEKHEKKMKSEASALFNAYETINRNRELNGEEPLKMICLSNANDIANPVFVELGIVEKVIKMQEKGNEVYINKDAGIAVICPNKSPISNAKRQTAIYKLTKNTEFGQMALDNTFADVDKRRVKSQNLREYRPVVACGEICVYVHKSDPRKYYVSHHIAGTPKERFSSMEDDLKLFRARYNHLPWEIICGNVEYETYSCRILLTKYLDM